MIIIYGIVINKSVKQLLAKYLVTSKKYEKYLADDRSICQERFRDSSDEFLIRWLENNCYFNEFFSEIESEYSNQRCEEIFYIGKRLFDSDDEAQFLERNGEVVLKLGKVDKQQVKDDIDHLVAIMPSLKDVLEQPDFKVIV